MKDGSKGRILELEKRESNMCIFLRTEFTMDNSNKVNIIEPTNHKYRRV